MVVTGKPKLGSCQLILILKFHMGFDLSWGCFHKTFQDGGLEVISAHRAPELRFSNVPPINADTTEHSRVSVGTWVVKQSRMGDLCIMWGFWCHRMEGMCFGYKDETDVRKMCPTVHNEVHYLLHVAP